MVDTSELVHVRIGRRFRVRAPHPFHVRLDPLVGLWHHHYRLLHRCRRWSQTLET